MDHIHNSRNGNHSKKRRTSSGNGSAFGRSAAGRYSSSNHSVSSSASRSSIRSRKYRRSHNIGSARGRSIPRSSNRRYPGTAETPASSSSLRHIVCAIGENLARETCVVSLDLSAPFLLNVTKQSNGQSYSETIAYLSVLCPDEVLMNEGRYHSPLARKVLQHFDIQRIHRNDEKPRHQNDPTVPIQSEGLSSPCDEEGTVVKFISRAYFDQTKGADLLRKLARQDTYDSTMVEEYILLSSSHAVLHYTQLTLGAVSFTKHCLDVRVNSGGHNNHRMEIDRSTLLQLELLTNNSELAHPGKSGSSNRKHSLISTMDCTKTSVGHRLLRTTLMAPPCRMDTITARLDLVDAFLHNEDLFYATLHQLQNLASLDHMLTNIVVVPSRSKRRQRRQGPENMGLGISVHDSSNNIPVAPSAANSGFSSSNNSVVSARDASKGISGLVCIKSTLAAIPTLASILRNHLDRLEHESNHQSTEREEGIDKNQDEEEAREEASIATAKTSLLVGLGVGKGHGVSDATVSSSFTIPKDHQLLRAIIFALSQEELDVVRKAINEAFTESTSYTRNANAMKHQECFALRSSNDNGMMDILRKTFLSNVDDIYKKADEYAEVHGISYVAVKYSTTRGYYLSLPLDAASNLPNEFIQPSKSGKFIYCTTEEVQSLNMRAQDNIQDLLILTHERIQEVLDIARSKYDALARLSDAVALLDLCHSFADKVTLSKLPWARPILTDGTAAAAEENESTGADENGDSEGPDDSYAIAICNGRYGIDVDNSVLHPDGGPGDWIANDTYASLSKNLTIVSGINGSGKSTYLKQIAIMVLLAHCGSYVPAEQAMIPITNRICARMMTADDQENNISSFMLEMKETAFICKNATSRSLILLDELGRATSNEDGVAIAWAVAESLLAKGAMTYFVTHYPQLCQMSRVYPAVQNQHLKSSIDDDENGGIKYTHKIGVGPCDVTSSYGVDMALSCGWPLDVVQEARRIENTLKDKLAESPLCAENTDIDKEIRYKKALKTTVQKLVNCVTADCEPSLASLRTSLQNLKVSLQETVPESEIAKLLDENTNDKP